MDSYENFGLLRDRLNVASDKTALICLEMIRIDALEEFRQLTMFGKAITLNGVTYDELKRHTITAEQKELAVFSLGSGCLEEAKSVVRGSYFDQDITLHQLNVLPHCAMLHVLAMIENITDGDGAPQGISLRYNFRLIEDDDNIFRDLIAKIPLLYPKVAIGKVETIESVPTPMAEETTIDKVTPHQPDVIESDEPNPHKVERKLGLGKKCCLFSYSTAPEAMKNSEFEEIEHFGGEEDGAGYSWCDGSRKLLRCRRCGVLFLNYKIKFLPMGYDDDTVYHSYYLPVASRQEAVEYCKKYIVGYGLESSYKGKKIWFNNNDVKWCWNKQDKEHTTPAAQHKQNISANTVDGNELCKMHGDGDRGIVDGKTPTKTAELKRPTQRIGKKDFPDIPSHAESFNAEPTAPVTLAKRKMHSKLESLVLAVILAVIFTLFVLLIIHAFILDEPPESLDFIYTLNIFLPALLLWLYFRVVKKANHAKRIIRGKRLAFLILANFCGTFSAVGIANVIINADFLAIAVFAPLFALFLWLFLRTGKDREPSTNRVTIKVKKHKDMLVDRYKQRINTNRGFLFIFAVPFGINSFVGIMIAITAITTEGIIMFAVSFPVCILLLWLFFRNIRTRAGLLFRLRNTIDIPEMANRVPKNSIFAGQYDTFGIRADGTVATTDANSFGELDVGSWTNIIAISEGDFHTVGLRADGTVVAVSYGDENQLNVDDWTNITSISSGLFHTVGLKKDGTVVTVVGTDDTDMCATLDTSKWTDIIAISAGGFRTVGLKTDGTVIMRVIRSNKTLKIKNWTEIIAISASNASHTVGLRADGTVVAVGENDRGQLNVNSWADIVSISAGFGYTVGLKADGTVVAVGDNSEGQLNVNSWADIISISAGNSHTVGLKNDGTLVVTGDLNLYGRLNVTKWTDIRTTIG